MFVEDLQSVQQKQQLQDVPEKSHLCFSKAICGASQEQLLAETKSSLKFFFLLKFPLKNITFSD